MSPIRNGTLSAPAKRALYIAALLSIPGSLIALPVLWWLNHYKGRHEWITTSCDTLADIIRSRGVDGLIDSPGEKNCDNDATTASKT